MEVVSIVSALLSLVGAVVAVWQAGRAKKLRDEILHDRKKRLLVDAFGIAREARNESRKIVTPVGKPFRGIDEQQVVDSIRDCLERIRDDGHRIGVAKLDQLLSVMERQLDVFIQESDDAKKHLSGDKLYKTLGEIVSVLSEEIDREI